MDLAKIRKKFLQVPKVPDVEPGIAPAAQPEQVKTQPVTEPMAQNSTEAESLPKESDGATDFFSEFVSPVVVPPLQERPVFISPLEAILAGRTAAGCDDETVLADEVTSEAVFESCLEFLCFRVSDEIYGINIMDIKELIKPREVTEVPRAPAFVSGVLSLRGIIIPIIDMRVRLGLVREVPTGKERIVVIRTGTALSGLLVDEVIQVVKVPHDSIEPTPAVLDVIDRDFISGLGRADGKLIIILNLETIADINLC